MSSDYKIMRYPKFDTSGTSITGSPIFASSTPITGSPLLTSSVGFIPWQPSSWPEAPTVFDKDIHNILEIIFKKTVTGEIDNVISDAIEVNRSIEHRGHVIAIAQLCAIDTLASYAFFDETAKECTECGIKDSKIKKYTKFILEYFPGEYKKHAQEINKLYRNTMIHSWNLFEVGISPDQEMIRNEGGTLYFGLINFQESLKASLDKFLEKLERDPKLQRNVIGRYRELKGSAKS